MRAVVVRSFGGTDVIEIADVPVPEPRAGQVRIRVEAATVNPVDVATRAGALADAGLMPRRAVTGLGWDAAGTVDAVGPGVHAFAAGDSVIAILDRLATPLGAQAEYLVVDAAAVAPAPSGVGAVEAATIPLNGLTALQGLDLLALPPGASLLVTGAAGAVGGYAVQLAAARGLRVVAVAGRRDEGAVRALGAEAFVPRDADLSTAVRELFPQGVDGALDAAVVGPAALAAVRNEGAFVPVVAGAAPPELRGIRVAKLWIRGDGVRLASLSALAGSGGLTLRVADVLPLDGVAAAHERLEKGGLRGRLVLTP